MTIEVADELTRLRLLHELSSAFTTRLELDELVPLVVGRCREVLGAGGASILLHDPERNELYFPYTDEVDPHAASVLSQTRIPAGSGFAGTVLQTGRSIRVDDVQADPRHYRRVDESTGVPTRNLLCVPLVSPRTTVGVLQVVNRGEGAAFTDADLALLEGIAGSVALAIENAKLYARLKASEADLRAEVVALRRDAARERGFPEIVGRSAAMLEVLDLMASAASTPLAVLIEGETGTGKELVARGIHRSSPRARAPFVAVNCAALPESLLENELFGHRRGAFTGAVQDQRGLFEAAERGTIFLDEVGEMPPAMQAKLLRVLQEGEVVPIGDQRPRRVDVRVISATNRDLLAAAEHNAFRADLYYRLAGFPLRLPALRERRDDVPPLAQHVLALASVQQHKKVAGFTPEAMECLVGYAWPGNVRELQNEVGRAVALVEPGGAVDVRHLSAKLRSGRAAGESVTEPVREPARVADLREARAVFERRHVLAVLDEHGGNITRAAQALGLSRFMLQRKLKDYGLR